MVRRIEPVPEPLKWAHLYLNALEGEKEFKRHREDGRELLLPFLMEQEQDENGDYYYEFPNSIIVGDDMVPYKGLKAQRRVSEYINEEKAREIIARHDLAGRCIRVYEVSEVDYDELYAANQEGIISDEEIDTILELSESYALVKVKA